MNVRRARALLGQHAAALVPGSVVVGLMIVWAIHNGGYDDDTWYWGALLALALLAVVAVLGRKGQVRFSRTSVIALSCFALYVGWSYLSIAWAASPGDALDGSNRALLYLIVFTLMLALPWTPEAALVALVAFTLAVGAIAVVILLRFASATHISALLLDGRLAAPTGYFNASVALFSLDAILAIVLATRRELPGLIRGALIGVACAGLQLAIVGQSRGWLFTLPLVALAVVVVASDRIRLAVAAAIPIAGALIPVHRLLGVYNASGAAHEATAATHAGRTGLILCVVAMVVGTVLAWTDGLVGPRSVSRARVRAAGAIVAAVVVAAVAIGAVVATHGDPAGFISRQWKGFSHPPRAPGSGSHFATVGSGRYDFWRVSLDALLAHPVGGLGQDNFADYYIVHRRTNEQPAWTHSLELRLVAHTGFVGTALFSAFMIAALAAALRVRRRAERPLTRALAGAALVPLIVWLIHGSVDWFWEMPALSGPALGFLAVAIALGRQEPSAIRGRGGSSAVRREPSAERGEFVRGFGSGGAWAPAVAVLGALALIAATAALGFSYLSVREVSTASDIASRNPTAALHDLSRAADLNPLSAEPGRLAGTIALEHGLFDQAERWFGQAISRQPGGWYGWLGQGLAASALGDSGRARSDFLHAAAINRQDVATREALARVDSTHPLSPAQALRLLVLVQ